MGKLCSRNDAVVISSSVSGGYSSKNPRSTSPYILIIVAILSAQTMSENEEVLRRRYARVVIRSVAAVLSKSLGVPNTFRCALQYERTYV